MALHSWSPRFESPTTRKNVRHGCAWLPSTREQTQADPKSSLAAWSNPKGELLIYWETWSKGDSVESDRGICPMACSGLCMQVCRRSHWLTLVHTTHTHTHKGGEREGSRVRLNSVGMICYFVVLKNLEFESPVSWGMQGIYFIKIGNQKIWWITGAQGFETTPGNIVRSCIQKTNKQKWL